MSRGLHVSAQSTKSVSRNFMKNRSASARSRTLSSVLAKRKSEGKTKRGSVSSVRPSRGQESSKKESGGFGTKRTSGKKSKKET